MKYFGVVSMWYENAKSDVKGTFCDIRNKVPNYTIFVALELT